MKKMSETIVFFGSGPVAAASLSMLAENFQIEAVITKPQPPHHREAFPVLLTADSLGLKTFTPNSRTELSELFAAKPVTSRVGVVIDYGFIINQDVIDYFPYGIVNSHFSLLPEWRGADPITFAILSGQKRTGVSLMLITAGMDEGPLLGFGLQDIEPGMTTPLLTEKLIRLSDGLLAAELPRYLSGETKLIDQLAISMRLAGYPAEPSYSRKLTKEDGVLDWNKPAKQLEREVRAFIEWPKSRTTLAGKDVVVTKAHVITESSGAIGTIWRAGKQFGIHTSRGTLIIDALKPAGKAEMPAESFLAGYGQHL